MVLSDFIHFIDKSVKSGIPSAHPEIWLNLSDVSHFMVVNDGPSAKAVRIYLRAHPERHFKLKGLDSNALLEIMEKLSREKRILATEPGKKTARKKAE